MRTNASSSYGFWTFPNGARLIYFSNYGLFFVVPLRPVKMTSAWRAPAFPLEFAFSYDATAMALTMFAAHSQADWYEVLPGAMRLPLPSDRLVLIFNSAGVADDFDGIAQTMSEYISDGVEHDRASLVRLWNRPVGPASGEKKILVPLS